MERITIIVCAALIALLAGLAVFFSLPREDGKEAPKEITGAIYPPRETEEPRPAEEDLAAIIIPAGTPKPVTAAAGRGDETAEPEKLEEEPQPVLRYVGKMQVYGYDTCIQCCGKTDGITASGAAATVGRTVAATKDFPFGTVLYIEGIGERVVEDRGGLAPGVLDVLCEDHAACYAITGKYDVYEVERDGQG